jgi:hypothetical protein
VPKPTEPPTSLPTVPDSGADAPPKQGDETVTLGFENLPGYDGQPATLQLGIAYNFNWSAAPTPPTGCGNIAVFDLGGKLTGSGQYPHSGSKGIFNACGATPSAFQILSGSFDLTSFWLAVREAGTSMTVTGYKGSTLVAQKEVKASQAVPALVDFTGLKFEGLTRVELKLNQIDWFSIDDISIVQHY